MESTTQPVASLEPLVSVADVEEILGVSRVTVWRLTRDGDLPFVKVGDRTLFEPADVRAFIAERRHEER